MCMANCVPFETAQVFFGVALVIGLLKRFSLKRGREGSLKMRFCVSGHWNSSVFNHYLSRARSKIVL